jgi:DNA-binding CsgD family transcriptional regulator
MGAVSFAERAETEIRATGATVRKRDVERATDLTAQEAQVANLVVSGDSNRDVAAKLFISPATVDYHLRKVFSKLGITRRTQLAHALPPG